MKRHLIYILLVFSSWSCTERIDITLDENFVRLVVEGNVTTDPDSHLVKLSKTSDYFYNLPPEMVTGASVTITENGVVHKLTETSAGHYYTEKTFYGMPGNTYTLDILLDKPIGGHTEYSATSFLNNVEMVDSIGLLFHPDWGNMGIWEVKCYVLDPISEDFYRFMILRNGVMITDTLSDWFVIEDKFFNGNYVNGAAIGFLDQESPEEMLNPGDIVTAEVHSIGKDYAAFIGEAQSELWGSNPLFSGPPANVKGNINNGAFGFFAAYSITRAEAIVPSDY